MSKYAHMLRSFSSFRGLGSLGEASARLRAHAPAGAVAFTEGFWLALTPRQQETLVDEAVHTHAVWIDVEGCPQPLLDYVQVRAH